MNPSHLPIRELPRSQRPRERLRTFGVRVLPARELVALVVGSGGRQASALEVADRVMERCRGRLRSLAALDPAALEEIPGVGRATAARLLAAVELGSRAAGEEVPDRMRIRGPEDVYRFMAPRLRDLPHEEFHALLLNTQHRVLRVALVSRGILDASLIHPREVFRPAILENAASVVLVHNHPSGDPTPSPEDRAVTRQLSEAGRTMGIRVLDHLVVGARGWSSAAGDVSSRRVA
ncbi:MAG: DNA repair protein RadC [Gemmatimonadales bacterium]|nr:MAG: DNA repair protein RadC [Gemmatimonadales bacterium]